MTAVEAFARLRSLGLPAIETGDASVVLGLSSAATTHMLSRLAGSGLITKIKHGTWWVAGDVDPYRLPEHLTAPMDSYLSLQTALHFHGVIEQIPQQFYVASLARSQQIATAVGHFSVHHLIPELYGGFEETATGAKMATPEKALFDLAWLSATRDRRFAGTPELSIPETFRHAEVSRWIGKIPSARVKTLVERSLAAMLQR
jgi:predicted transcriptional regulator of viral defense system